MRKIILILLLVFLSVSAFAESYFYEPDFSWTSASVMAQGGSFIANAHGFDALMYNPAAFVSDKVEFSFSIQPYADVQLFDLIDDIDTATSSDGMSGWLTLLDSQLKTNGLGVGAEVGIGFVGKGLGVGLFVTADGDFPHVDSLLSANGTVYATAGLIGGYAYNFDIGELDLAVGLDVKALYRMKSRVDSTFITGIVSSMDDGGEFDYTSMDVSGGFAIGGDIGVNLSWRSLTIAAVLHNVGHLWYTYYGGTTLGDLVDSSQLPQEQVSDYYVTPMQLNFGIDFHPDLKNISKYIDPRIHVSYYWDLLIGLDEDELVYYDSKSFWLGLSAGAEVKLLNFLLIRAGINQGYFTAGMGIDFYVGELNVAVFSTEEGEYSGTEQQMGVAIEFAIRF